MRIDLDEYLPERVTVLNKVDAKDRTDGVKTDLWVKTVVDAAQFDVESSATEGDKTLNIATMYKVHLPKEGYIPYKGWVDKTSEGFTAREADFIVRGEVTEVVTASNIMAVLKGYSDVCKVNHVREAISDGLYPASRTGALRWLECVYCEGV